MSPNQLFLRSVASTLNKVADEQIIDVTGEQLARSFCGGRKHVGYGMPREINDSHNDIIRFAHEERGERDWMPTTEIYFDEQIYAKEIVDSDDRDIIRSLCLGHKKTCHGFRLARGSRDPFYERWTIHYHAVRGGVELAADQKSIRASVNGHLPNNVATKMITTAQLIGQNGNKRHQATIYPAFYHFHKKSDPAMKCIWTAPGSLWGGEKCTALLKPSLDRVRVNLVDFESEFRYMTEKKFRGVNPEVTLGIVRTMYGRLIYAIFQKSPGKLSLTKTEVFSAAKEIDIDAEIYKAMAIHQKPSTNLLEDEGDE